MDDTHGWTDSCGPNETLMSWEASLIFCICPEIVGSVIKRFAISFSVGPMMADPVARNMEFLFPRKNATNEMDSSWWLVGCIANGLISTGLISNSQQSLYEDIREHEEICRTTWKS